MVAVGAVAVGAVVVGAVAVGAVAVGAVAVGAVAVGAVAVGAVAVGAVADGAVAVECHSLFKQMLCSSNSGSKRVWWQWPSTCTCGNTVKNNCSRLPYCVLGKVKRSRLLCFGENKTQQVIVFRGK